MPHFPVKFVLKIATNVLTGIPAVIRQEKKCF
jgi:hypothetical protein